MSAKSFLIKLRRAGVSLRSEGTRLIAEAPDGVITSDLRAEIATRTTDIVRALEVESRAANPKAAAMKEIDIVAGLLAAAFKRYAAIPRLAEEQVTDKAALALSTGTSVHGGVA